MRFMRFVKEQLRTLGWYYGVALLVALVSLWAFGEIADEVLEAESQSFNQAVLVALHSLVPRSWTPLALGLSALISIPGVFLLGGGFELLLLRRKRHLDAATLAAVLVGGALLTVSLKQIFQQPRPTTLSPTGFELGPSFPSGHALMAFCLFGYFAVWLVSGNPRSPWRWLGAAGAVLLAGLVGLSRLFLGVHWPTDVLAGSFIGLFWLAVCLAGRRWQAKRSPRNQPEKNSAPP